MGNTNSKPIGKIDDDAKALIIEALDGEHTGGFDLDSIYKLKDNYVIIEFLKCDTVRPNDSHPKRYWFKNKQKFISLWEICTKLEGILYLVNYEDSREQLKIIRVHEMTNEGITKEVVKIWDFKEFQNWFKELNANALKK